jgi:hypothetical protein
MRRHRRVTLVVALGAAVACGGCIYIHTTSKNPPPAARGTSATTASAPPATPATPATATTAIEGRFINSTPWALALWVDVDPLNTARAEPVVLQPGGTKSWTLDRGPHRIVAQARAGSASRDERVVGRYDRTIELDPQRAGGWFLRFRESDFR